MSYRIIRQDLKNGKAQYQVQSNKWLGITAPFWHNCIVSDVDDDMNEVCFLACYSTMTEAEKYVTEHQNKIVKREVVKTYN